jgi:hypothetical protein
MILVAFCETPPGRFEATQAFRVLDHCLAVHTSVNTVFNGGRR